MTLPGEDVPTVTEHDRWLDAAGPPGRPDGDLPRRRRRRRLMDAALESAGSVEVFSDDMDGGRNPFYDGTRYRRWER